MREYEDWIREEEEARENPDAFGDRENPAGPDDPEGPDIREADALEFEEEAAEASAMAEDEFAEAELRETAPGVLRTWVVPRVCDIDRCLREQFFDGILSQMNEYLARGELSRALGMPVVCERIRPEQARLGPSVCRRLNRTDFLADIPVTAEITVAADGRDVSVSRTFWLTLWFGTEEGFRFEAQGVSCGDGAPDRSLWKLDRHLVPVLGKEETEDGAERMWKTYLPEASSPSERRAEALAAALGLRIRSLRLHGQNATKAVLFLQDCTVAVQEEEKPPRKGSPGAGAVPPPVPVPVEAGTIVINTAAAHREGLSLEILHECVHYEWHLLFFRLQRLSSTNPREIPCRRVQNSTGRAPGNPLRWMEKQAREGAVALLLPEKELRERAWRLFQAASTAPAEGDYLYHDGFRWDRVIRDLRAEYAASGQTVGLATVRGRLVSLGFSSARGTVHYVDGRYITPFAFSQEYSDRGHTTYVVRRKEMADLYRRDRRFREQMGRGDFAWVDGHICVNDSQYLRQTGKGARLTPWANAHVDACCLRFGKVYLRDRESVLFFSRAESCEEYNRQYNEYLDRRMRLSAPDRAKKRDELMRHFPNTFSDALKYVMENRDGRRITCEELAAASQVSRKTIERYRRADQKRYQEDKLIALCIGMHLPPWLSRALLSRARIIVGNDGPRGYYGEILDCCFMDSVADVQQYLEDNGYPKLQLQEA